MKSKLIAIAAIFIAATVGFYSPYYQDWRSVKNAIDDIMQIDKKVDHLSMSKVKQVDSAAKFDQVKDIHIEQINLLHQKYINHNSETVRALVNTRHSMSHFLLSRKSKFLRYSEWYNKQLVTPVQEVYRSLPKVKNNIKQTRAFISGIYQEIIAERKRYPSYLKSLPINENDRVFLWQYFDQESKQLLALMDPFEFELLDKYFNVLSQYVHFFEQVGQDASFNQHDVIQFEFSLDTLKFNQLSSMLKRSIIAIGNHRRDKRFGL
jgi:hypothetical protein